MRFYYILLIFTINLAAQQNLDQIVKKELMKTVEFLSDKELAGRLPGHIGYQKAADFMAKEMSNANLKKIFEESYFQKLNVEYDEILPGESFSIIKNGNKIKFELGNDYVYRGFTGSGNISAGAVFCGYGISQTELGYDDYSNTDVNGKVAVVFKYNPKWKIDDKGFANGNPREKAIVAAKHGAIGILFVSFPNDAEPQKPLGSVIHGEGEQMINFPELHIGLNIADSLFAECGFSLKELQTKIDSTKKPFSLPLKNSVQINVKTNYEKEKEVVNITGLIEGTDPKLKNEYIIVGAHLDHVGQQAGKIFFPGANDNASGSAALLQLIRAFSKEKEKLKRSIIFVFFASEEQGLNGSDYFAKHPPFPKENIAAMINMDCIGCGDSIQIGGGQSSNQLWQIAKHIDENNSKLMITNTWKGGGADAEPFYQIGIPTLYFVTTNGYKHLHLLSDKPETLNPDLFEAISRLAYLTVFEICNR
jgi:aminopeptidase YwaD